MYHLHVSRTISGRKGSATKRVDYNSRHGKYKNRADKVRLTRSLNMPTWASGNNREYWQALDGQKKRCNARLFFSIEAAIPRDLSKEQQNKLVEDFVREIASMSAGWTDGFFLPAMYAIHEGVHKDDDTTGRRPNPHVHIMLSTSINDNVDRPQSDWFRRANSADPASGGAPRSSYIGTLRWLLAVRETWARMANAALKLAGLPAKLDHRSNRARGLLAVPTVHLGPKAAAAARAGRPGPKARRNDRIRTFNKKMKRTKLRRDLQVRRPDLLVAVPDQRERMFEREHREACVELVDLLQAHPLAGEVDRLSDHASLLFRTPDPAPDTVGISMASMKAMIPKLRAVLADEWECVRLRGRLWWVLRDTGDAIVVGNGFVATDATSDGTGRVLAQVAAALEMSELVGHCSDLEDRECVDVDRVLGGLGIDLVWQSPGAKSSARAAPR